MQPERVPTCRNQYILFTSLALLFSTLPLYGQSSTEQSAVSLPDRPLRSRKPQPENTAADFEKRGLPIHRSFHGSEAVITGAQSDLYLHYIEHYSSRAGRAWLEAVMKRSEPWMGHIRARIEHYRLPPELAYLPVIESSFTAQAVSRSGAVGLWQFMKNSISPFDMHVTEWMDERRDFWKATDGALRKLKENYDALGDWELALAAYNAGLGAVRTAIRRAGTGNYQELCDRGFLKRETIHYVPKFRAVSHIMSRARRSNVSTGWMESPQWTRIPPGRSVDLGLLANTAGIDKKDLVSGNMELSWGVSPPDRNYQLKVRTKDYEAVAAALARKDIQLVHYYIHYIKSGDTLSALSRHYGVSVTTIEQANPGIQARYLRLGQRVLVPALKEAGPYVRSATKDLSIRFDGSYLVRKGDTLWSIALAHGVDPEQLANENGLNLSSIIREGQRLKTPILKEE